jgi:hypothetical protein
MDNDIIKRVFERIDKLRAEGKLPQIDPNDWEDEPTALAYTPDNQFYSWCNMYTEGEVDDIVYTLIDKFLNYNGSYSDNEELKKLYQQIKNKMNITETFEGPAHNLVWKNRYNEIIDDVYKKYIKDSEGFSTLEQVEYGECTYSTSGMSFRPFSIEGFIIKIKTDDGFSEKWGVKITERELTLEERYNKWFNNNYETGMERYFDPNNLPDFDNDYYEPTPTKEMALEYKEEIFSYYE